MGGRQLISNGSHSWSSRVVVEKGRTKNFPWIIAAWKHVLGAHSNQDTMPIALLEPSTHPQSYAIGFCCLRTMHNFVYGSKRLIHGLSGNLRIRGLIHRQMVIYGSKPRSMQDPTHRCIYILADWSLPDMTGLIQFTNYLIKPRTIPQYLTPAS